ncbi:hypothetical protein ACFL6C_12475 [Myxococcota bacterium]
MAGISVRFFLDKSEYTFGEEIWGNLEIRNQSQSLRIVPITSDFQNSNQHSPLYDLEKLVLTSEEGTTELFPVCTNMYHVSGVRGPIQPQQTIKERSLLVPGLWNLDGTSRRVKNPAPASYSIEAVYGYGPTHPDHEPCPSEELITRAVDLGRFWVGSVTTPPFSFVVRQV